MNFKELYLDLNYYHQLETLFARENFLTKDKYQEKLDTSTLDLMKKRYVSNKRMILLYLLLFEQIDTNYTYYDFSFLENYGLINENSHFQHDVDKGVIIEKTNLPLSTYASKTAFEIIEANKYKFSKTITDTIYNEYSRELELNKLQEYIDQTMQGIIEYQGFSYLNYYDKFLDGKAPILDEDTLNEVITFFRINLESYSDSIYHSITKNIPFANSFWSDRNYKVKSIKKNNPRLIDDVYYLVRTNLTDEIKYLPYPTSIKEVLEWREKKELKRFRKLLSIWIDKIQVGDRITVMQIKKDISKANKELKNLGKWKEYKKSPINFWINSIGGHIPILSNILTLIFTMDSIYESHINRKHNWILLNN